MEPFYEHLAALKRKRRQFIVCADWNTCHQNIDLKNWRSNRKNSGFMPHERAWLGRIYDDLKWVDIFREITDEPDLYTWWSNRSGARQRNIGWRIDYFFITPCLEVRVKQAYFRLPLATDCRAHRLDQLLAGAKLPTTERRSSCARCLSNLKEKIRNGN